MADYGVVVMAFMAQRPGEVLTAQQVSRDAGLSAATVSKLLKLFARHNLLESQRGVGGGYRLAIPAEDISVANIVEAVEGPIALTLCVDKHGGCRIESLCPMCGGWDKINTALRTALDEVSLATMASPVHNIPTVSQTASVPEASCLTT